jgi:hypothetical protein
MTDINEIDTNGPLGRPWRRGGNTLDERKDDLQLNCP